MKSGTAEIRKLFFGTGLYYGDAGVYSLIDVWRYETMKNIATLFPKLSAERRREMLSVPSGIADVVLDTDTYNEIDDQFAVAYAMLSPEKINVRAITAAPFFNERSSGPGDGMHKSYDEICRLLNLLGKAPENFAFRGAESYLQAPGQPVESDAVRRIVELAREAKADGRILHIVAIGAPTNVASALLFAPEIIDSVVVVWLGGHAFYTVENQEFNLRQDVSASQVLFESGVPLVLIPCRGVAENLYTTVPILERRCAGSGSLGKYLYEQAAEEVGYDPTVMRTIWDISTVAWFVVPDAVCSEYVSAPVLNDDTSWTTTGNRHEIRLATYIYKDAVFNSLFQKLADYSK